MFESWQSFNAFMSTSYGGLTPLCWALTAIAVVPLVSVAVWRVVSRAPVRTYESV